MKKYIICNECHKAPHSWESRGKIKRKCYNCDKYLTKRDIDEVYREERPKKRSFLQMDHISMGLSRQRLLDHIKTLDDGQMQAFWSILYLTGARVSEIVTYSSSYKKELVNYKGELKMKAIKFPGLRKFQFQQEMVNGHKWMHIKGLRVLKVRDVRKSRRNVSISYEHDGEFLHYIDHYLKHIPHERILFKFSRVHAWRVINLPEYGGMGIYPHLLRPLRAIDLRKLYGWRLEDIVAFVGWQSYETAKFYLKLDTTDLIEATDFSRLGKNKENQESESENPA